MGKEQMKTHACRWVAFAAAAVFSLNAQAGTPPKFQPQDMGPAAASAAQTVSIILKVQHPDQLDDYIAATVNPRSRLYHRFLSVNEFKEQFAPSNLQVRLVTDYMKSKGIVINEVYTDNLLIKATGTVDQFNSVFSTSIHEYVDHKGRHFRNHHGPFSIPRLLNEVVLTVAGLDTQASQFLPKHRSVSSNAALARVKPEITFPLVNGTATGMPGDLTVGDVANQYGVNPLYSKGINGRGRTVGIATLANFQPEDAYTYWDMIGLKVLPNRITQIHVDGGGELSSDAGTGETSLDVEQSGGLAPFAKVRVYDAPNTEAGFIDVFYKAASENLVDTLSISWGGSEIFDFETPFTTDTHLDLVATHQAFAEFAAQGISMFVSSGDDGAYDANGAFPSVIGDPAFVGPFNAPLTIDAPGDDPYVTAAGGTTLAATLTLKHGTIVIPTERIWAWDYLNDYLFNLTGVKNDEFSAGGGGGVSFVFPAPDYQRVVNGLKRTEPNQNWLFYPNFAVSDDGIPNNDLTQPVTLFNLPGNFAGRNVPDISLNADPETGYILFSTVDGGFNDFFGGTSFVAPQLNGIFSLIGQANGTRLGLVNPQLYQALADHGYSNNGPFEDITSGTDWFYKGKTGYDQGTGLGTINASALVKVFR
jgi:kumamolisin